MAAFNAERTIGDAIQSVLAQTYPDFELIICDDASTDNTITVIERFTDCRIKLIRNQVNLQVGPTRDRAIRSARGTWITVIDADDQYAHDRLETLLRVAETFPDDLIVDDIVDCHDSPRGLVPWKTIWDKNDFPPTDAEVRTVDLVRLLQEKRPLIKQFFRASRADLVGASHGFKVNSEDLAFVLPFFANGSVLRYVPKPMYLYRMTPGSLSTSNPARHRLYREVCEEALHMFIHDPRAAAAIETKIGNIRRVEIYQVFFSALRSLQLHTAFKVFALHPWVAIDLVGRIVGRLPFYMHRMLNNGRRRRVE